MRDVLREPNTSQAWDFRCVKNTSNIDFKMSYIHDCNNYIYQHCSIGEKWQCLFGLTSPSTKFSFLSGHFLSAFLSCHSNILHWDRYATKKPYKKKWYCVTLSFYHMFLGILAIFVPWIFNWTVLQNRSMTGLYFPIMFVAKQIKYI